MLSVGPHQRLARVRDLPKRRGEGIRRGDEIEHPIVREAWDRSFERVNDLGERGMADS